MLKSTEPARPLSEIASLDQRGSLAPWPRLVRFLSGSTLFLLRSVEPLHVVHLAARSGRLTATLRVGPSAVPSGPRLRPRARYSRIVDPSGPHGHPFVGRLGCRGGAFII